MNTLKIAVYGIEVTFLSFIACCLFGLPLFAAAALVLLFGCVCLMFASI